MRFVCAPHYLDVAFWQNTMVYWHLSLFGYVYTPADVVIGRSKPYHLMVYRDFVPLPPCKQWG